MTFRPQYTPKAFRRTGAAAYLSISPTKFDTWVKQGRMPKPKRVDGIVFWDRHEIDVAYDALVGNKQPNSDVWDQVSV